MRQVTPELRELIVKDAFKRHLVFQHFFPLIVETSHKDYDASEYLYLYTSKYSLITSDDFFYLLDYLEVKLTQSSHRLVLAKFLRNIFSSDSRKELDAIYYKKEIVPELGSVFKEYFDAVNLKSEEANDLKQSYERLQRWRNTPTPYNKVITKQSNSSASLAENIATLLKAFENGNVAKWEEITSILIRSGSSSASISRAHSDLTSLEEWGKLNDEIKSRIIAAGAVYLTQEAPEDAIESRGLNTSLKKAFAGYRAFELLARETPSELVTLESKVWAKWTPVLLVYPIQIHYPRSREIQKELVDKAYEKVPQQVVRSGEKLLLAQDSSGSYPGILDKFDLLNKDDFFVNAMFEILKTKKLGLNTFQTLSEKLLSWTNSSLISKYLEGLIQETYTDEASNAVDTVQLNTVSNNFFGVIAAVVLVKYSHNISSGWWDTIWNLMQENTKWGQRFIKELAADRDHREEPQITKKLSYEQLAQLFIWIVKNYKASQLYNSNNEPSQEVQNLSDLQGALLTYLTRAGTYEALMALKMLRPVVEKISQILLVAEDSYYRQDWQPFEPSKFIQFIRDTNLRYVQTGDQLLAVLVESLQRLEEELQGQTPAAQFLWNEVLKETETQDKQEQQQIPVTETEQKNEVKPKARASKKPKNDAKEPKYDLTPKDENALSDYIKLHFIRDLKNRNIIFNREVEIFSSTGKGGQPGERTDIHVQAIRYSNNQDKRIDNSEANTLTAIIEVKGCWHKEVSTAMQTQLFERYLTHNNVYYGLYLVGWYECPQWSEADMKKKGYKKKTKTIEVLKRELEEQASQLSTGEFVIKSLVLNAALR